VYGIPALAFAEERQRFLAAPSIDALHSRAPKPDNAHCHFSLLR
jgi:hypothetical protein